MDILDKLKGGANKVAFEGDKLIRVTRAQAELNKFRHQLDSYYMDLGRVAYGKYRLQEDNGILFNDLCNKVTGQKQTIEIKEKELLDLKTETFSFNSQLSPGQPQEPENTLSFKSPEAGNTLGLEQEYKICQYCQKEIPIQAKFCPSCGKKP